MKFSIRDLLWLLTLTAVLTAWGVDHWRLRNPPLCQHPAPQAFDVLAHGFSFSFGSTRKEFKPYD
jgi:hypothetical protein